MRTYIFKSIAFAIKKTTVKLTKVNNINFQCGFFKNLSKVFKS